MFQNSWTLDILRERFQCTPIGPKLKFWVFSHHFDALKRQFGFAPHPYMSKTRVLGCFMPFHCRTWPIVKISIGVHLMHEFMPPKPFLILSQPIHYFRSETHVLGGSMPFRSRTWHVAKTGIEVHLMHEFMPLDLFLVFCSKHAQSTTLGLKLMFWMVLRHFIVAPDPLQKLVSWCI